MKKFISFSGGVESSTMCVLFGNNADAIFSDTGFEHKEIYDRIDLVEKWCKEFHQRWEKEDPRRSFQLNTGCSNV